MALLLTHAAQLLTLAGENRARRGAQMRELGLVNDGAVLIEGDRILRAGPADDVTRALPSGLSPIEEIDCRGRLVTPGLVDSHTHLVFAAPRLDDYERRLGGMDYAAIAAAGGGIASSVRRLRAATAQDLLQQAAGRITEALRHGTTTIEIKSGYGLELEAERKSLEAAAAAPAAAGAASLQAPRTFLGAHTVPPGVDRRHYLDDVCERMLPALTSAAAAAYRPEFADAFCDPSGFTLEETERVLRAAQTCGLRLKLHAEQFAHLGGAALALRLGAVSVDHLDAADENDLRLLARAETVATLIPGANFFLGQPYPAARDFIAAGAAVALATDFNPGTCPILSLPLIMSLACSGMRLLPAEAWTAVTINGAAALARAALCGSLQPGKRADLAIFETSDYREVPYYAGSNLCGAVVIGGQWRSLPVA